MYLEFQPVEIPDSVDEDLVFGGEERTYGEGFGFVLFLREVF